MDVGLRLLPQITSSKGTSNVLFKSAMRKTIPQHFCFLKTCNLWNKQLREMKVSAVECRNRQIVLDEIRELESSTKKMEASYRQCCNEARRDTRVILEDLRMQRL
ncbi:hypothetical protein VNO78_26998 [Psophocarpus tetragonolobus]|uniref:Uncharacterized protein n=1 Tax=Psophocarpus tetragonolobus TaxID=3891 RepID=A0AAN9S2N8_PSOTE